MKNIWIGVLILSWVAVSAEPVWAQKKKAAPQPSVDEAFEEELLSSDEEVDTAGDDLENELKKLENEEFKDLNVDEDAAPVLEESPVVESAPAPQAPPAPVVEERRPAPVPKPVVQKPAPSKPAPRNVAPQPTLRPQIQEPPPPEIAEEPPAPVVEEPPPPVAVSTPPPVVSDEPNDEFEARMARIYQRFYSGQLSDEEWISIIGERRTETYQVQRGDTLWGVSETFFGNGFFWPKIWQLNNDSITNPHEVNKGDRIVFASGNLAQEPQISVAQNSAGEAGLDDLPEGPSSVTIPEGRKFQPVLQKLPPSLPDLQTDRFEYDQSGFAITRQNSPPIPEPFPITSYITEDAPEPAGKILEIETGGLVAATYQKIIVELAAADIGDIFTAYAQRPSIGGGAFGVGSGYPIDVLGEIEIIESLGDGNFKALVISSFDHLKVGSRLMRGPVPEGELSKRGRPSTAQSRILGGSIDSDRPFFGPHSLVFLEGGAGQGIAVGDILTVIRNDKLRGMSTPSNTTIAKVKVLYTTALFATGVVLEASDDVRPGDRTGLAQAEED